MSFNLLKIFSPTSSGLTSHESPCDDVATFVSANVSTSGLIQPSSVVDFTDNDDEYSLPSEPPYHVQSPRDDVDPVVLATASKTGFESPLLVGRLTFLPPIVRIVSKYSNPAAARVPSCEAPPCKPILRPGRYQQAPAESLMTRDVRLKCLSYVAYLTQDARMVRLAVEQANYVWDAAFPPEVFCGDPHYYGPGKEGEDIAGLAPAEIPPDHPPVLADGDIGEYDGIEEEDEDHDMPPPVVDLPFSLHPPFVVESPCDDVAPVVPAIVSTSGLIQPSSVVDFTDNDDEYSLPSEPPYHVQSPRDDVDPVVLATASKTGFESPLLVGRLTFLPPIVRIVSKYSNPAAARVPSCEAPPCKPILRPGRYQQAPAESLMTRDVRLKCLSYVAYLTQDARMVRLAVEQANYVWDAAFPPEVFCGDPHYYGPGKEGEDIAGLAPAEIPPDHPPVLADGDIGEYDGIEEEDEDHDMPPPVVDLPFSLHPPFVVESPCDDVAPVVPAIVSTSGLIQPSSVVDFPDNDDEYSLPLEPLFHVQSPHDDVDPVVLSTFPYPATHDDDGPLGNAREEDFLGSIWVRTTSVRDEPIVVRRSARVRARKLFMATC